jgi:hypothetical protein
MNLIYYLLLNILTWIFYFAGLGSLIALGGNSKLSSIGFILLALSYFFNWMNNKFIKESRNRLSTYFINDSLLISLIVGIILCFQWFLMESNYNIGKKDEIIPIRILIFITFIIPYFSYKYQLSKKNEENELTEPDDTIDNEGEDIIQRTNESI